MNSTTLKLLQTNSAMKRNINSFMSESDCALVNPSFNIDWEAETLKNDMRWKWGFPPSTNINYAWLSHIINQLNQNGIAIIVLANGSLASANDEGIIRQNMITADLVDCIVALPDKLFYSTGIPVCIWIMNRNKAHKGKTLFIDGRKLGMMVTRRLRELTDEEIRKIADTYINYKNDENYEDIQGFCKVADLDEIREHDYILTPGRYVGIEEADDDGEPFEEKMERLTQQLAQQFQKSKELEEEIRKQLGGIGYEI